MESYMEEAIELAKKARGYTKNNPLVGALIVKDGQVASSGYHQRYGGLHAERLAIENAKKKGINIEGSTLYVNLEPCCHYGKTPPCTQAIIDSGIKKVYVGCLDQNELVAGKGCQSLIDNGIQVYTGLLEEESKELNRHFFHYIKTGQPYVTVKYAMSLDGRIASYKKDSKWITSPPARRHVHQERSYNQAIMVGIGTVLEDDPMLNVRLDNPASPQPIRIICDSHLRVPSQSRIAQTARSQKTIIACLESSPERADLVGSGCEILRVKEKDGKLDLVDLMDKLGQKKIASLYVEGGARLNAGLLKEALIDCLHTYIGPKLVGGYVGEGLSPIQGFGFEKISDSLDFNVHKLTQIGQDIFIESRRC